MEAFTPTEPREFVMSLIGQVSSLLMGDDREGSDDSDTLNKEADVEKRNQELQKSFEQKMDNVGNKRSHSKVAVLLVSWEPEREDYIDAGDEVDRLAGVFENHYYFKFYLTTLISGTKSAVFGTL